MVALGLLGFALAYLGCRMPRPPRWLTEGLVSNVILPGILALLVLGAGLTLRFASSAQREAFGLLEGGLIAAIVVACALVWKLLRVRERVRAYEVQAPQETSAPVAAFPPPAEPHGDGSPAPAAPGGRHAA